MMPLAISLDILALILLAALLHAIWNAVVKADHEDRKTTLMVIVAGSGLLQLPFLLADPGLDPAAYGPLAASVAIHYAYFASLLLGYRLGDLGLVYPIARGLSPILIAVMGWLLFQEMLPPVALAGLVGASFGIMLMALGGHATQRPLKAVLAALVTGLLIAGYTVADGAGIRAAGGRWQYIYWLFLLDGLPFMVWLAWRWRSYWPAIKPKIGRLAGGIFANFFAYAIVIHALGQGGLAPVSALRESSTLMAMAIGIIFLGEKLRPVRLLAGLLIVSGLVVMRLGL